MDNNMTKKIIASLMLTLFGLSNSLLTISAMEDLDVPSLRTSGGEYSSLKLKGDVSYIQSDRPISISLRDSDVKQVLRMFADKAGMNIIFHNSVDGKVTLDLVEVPLNSAFDMIMNINNLNYVVENNTIIVAKSGSDGFNMAKQEMTLIPVRYVSANSVAEFLNKNIFAINKPGLSGSEIVTTNPVTNELIIFGSQNDVAIAQKVVDKFDKKPVTTTFKVNHTTPAEMANMICGMLLPATGSTGTSSSGASTGGAAGIMTGAASDYNDNNNTSSSFNDSSSGTSSSEIKLNEGVVACTLDGKSSGSISSLGVQNLAVSYYSQLGTISVLGGSEHQIEMIKDFIAHTDKKQPQAYLEVSIVELTEEGMKELQNTWNFYSGTFSASFDGTRSITPVSNPVFFKGNSLDTTSKYSGPATITYAIDYLIRNSKARVVVNPRIVINNGVESKIEVTQDYLDSVDVNASTSTGGTVVTRDYQKGEDQGVTVSITPFISPDGYVTMNIIPEYSTEIGQIDGEESTADGEKIQYKAGTLLSHRNLDLKNVRIKDGETLVIAGMIQEKEAKVVKKIPVLGDLPVVGAMFRSTTSEKSKSEMVIMLTPKIITDTEDATLVTDTL